PARATSQMSLGGNLDVATDPSNPVTVLGTVRDSLGRAHQVEFTFRKTGANANEWTWDATIDGTEAGDGEITFDQYGRLAPGTTGTLAWDPGGQAEPLDITADFSFLTQYAL